MRVLCVGSGGREHAIGRALQLDAALPTTPKLELLFAPGNSGTAQCGKNVPVAADDLSGLLRLAKDRAVNLVLVGPETPLCAGLIDRLRAQGPADLLVCGPTAAAARIEGSKAFSRELGLRLGLPGPRFRIVRRKSELAQALTPFSAPPVSAPPVIKADGLCGGKGVFLPHSQTEALSIGNRLLDGELGPAGQTLVLEERLHGVEASLFFACAGRACVALPTARDYKRLYDGDRGPNTGGMGAHSPHPEVNDSLLQDVKMQIVRPMLDALATAGTPFFGFLYLGLMLTAAGPKILEWNCRLGDPEAQVILPRLLPGEFLRLCLGIARDKLPEQVATRDDSVCAVVLSSAGYPQTGAASERIRLRPAIETPQRWVIHSGLRRDANGNLWTSGGRVLAVVAQAAQLAEARRLAYEGVAAVDFPGQHHRHDIGATALRT